LLFAVHMELGPPAVLRRPGAKGDKSGDCLADVNVVRSEPDVFGPVASDPTVSRMVDTLADDVDRALGDRSSPRSGQGTGLDTGR
jgi:hypothetical protein